VSVEYDLLLREAEASDASILIDFLNQIGQESDYTTLDETGMLMNPEQVAAFLEQQASLPNRISIVAFLNEELAGLVSITADSYKRVAHIGDVFVAVKKAFWNQGLGRILMEEVIDWATESDIIRKLALSVQVRNKRAIHLYKSLGFEIEGLQKRGAYLEEGKFLDVYLMGKLID
jgi:acetyltransferase, GNAT family